MCQTLGTAMTPFFGTAIRTAGHLCKLASESKRLCCPSFIRFLQWYPRVYLIISGIWDLFVKNLRPDWDTTYVTSTLNFKTDRPCVSYQKVPISFPSL